MSKREPDERLGRLTKLWCERLYSEKYGVTYPWSGREAKQLERLLAWVQSNEGAMNAESRTEDLMRAYLADSECAEKEHSLGWLCVKPQKWAMKRHETLQPRQYESCRFCGGGSEMAPGGLIAWEGKAYRCRCANAKRIRMDIREAPAEAFATKTGSISQRVCEIKDQEKFFRGFCLTGRLLKSINPVDYAELRQYFIDLFGKDRVVAMWNEVAESTNFIATTLRKDYGAGSEKQERA